MRLFRNIINSALVFFTCVAIGYGTGEVTLDMASDIGTVVTSFNRILSSSDTDVQKALDTIDNSAAYAGSSPTFGNVTISGLTASQAVFTDGSKVLVSNAISGTGSVAMTSGAALSNPAISISSAPADLAYSGRTATFTAGETLAAGDLVYFKSDGKVWKAGASATTYMPCVGLATAAITANAAGAILLEGFYRNDTRYNFTVGGQASAAAGLIYISAAVAGAETQTRPAAATNIVQIVGYAYSADIIYFNPDYTYVEVQ